MKNKAYPFLLMLFVTVTLSSCQSKEKTETSASTKKVVEIEKLQESKFSGKFSGIFNGSEIVVTLTSQNNSDKIEGELWMNNERATIKAAESNGVVSGLIIEDTTNKTYAIKMEFVSEKLQLSMTFPEYNNQSVTIELDKNSSEKKVYDVNPSKTRNANLVGTWRYTEVISSGSGEFYASFATDYFIQFLANGECITWTGKSAGGTNSATFDSDNANNIERVQWHTKENNLLFVNPQTQKEVSIPFYAEQNRMMLKGSVNRVYTRVN